MKRPNITRGQWAVDDRIDEQRQEGFWIDCAPADGTEPEEIALASIATVDPGQAKANAQAIAAVPDLLAALEVATDAIDKLAKASGVDASVVQGHIREALTKAGYSWSL